jgi:hypothetical protein
MEVQAILRPSLLGGDTLPNKWFLEYAADADLAIRETF